MSFKKEGSTVGPIPKGSMRKARAWLSIKARGRRPFCFLLERTCLLSAAYGRGSCGPHSQKHTVRSRPQKAGRMSQGAADRCRDLRDLVEAQREVRLRDPVDVTDFGARQAPRSEGPSLPIEPCDGNLSSARCVPEYSLVGQQDMGNSEIMIMDRGIADAGAMDEGALPGLRSGLLNRRSFLFGSAVGLGALGWPVARRPTT